MGTEPCSGSQCAWRANGQRAMPRASLFTVLFVCMFVRLLVLASLRLNKRDVLMSSPPQICSSTSCTESECCKLFPWRKAVMPSTQLVAQGDGPIGLRGTRFATCVRLNWLDFTLRWFYELTTVDPSIQRFKSYSGPACSSWFSGGLNLSGDCGSNLNVEMLPRRRNVCFLASMFLFRAWWSCLNGPAPDQLTAGLH